MDGLVTGIHALYGSVYTLVRILHIAALGILHIAALRISHTGRSCMHIAALGEFYRKKGKSSQMVFKIHETLTMSSHEEAIPRRSQIHKPKIQDHISDGPV